jgi:hypothetical protein
MASNEPSMRPKSSKSGAGYAADGDRRSYALARGDEAPTRERRSRVSDYCVEIEKAWM